MRMDAGNEHMHVNRIKTMVPVTIVLGNPPYAVRSRHTGAWIQKRLSLYTEGLGERNIQPLSDDYIKFFRLGHDVITRAGIGVLCFVSNNSYLDGIIHRKMRKELLSFFDRMIVLDLHGNGRKRERAEERRRP